MDESPDTPEYLLRMLNQPDQDLARKAFTEWAARYLTQPRADLPAMPSEAFLAGFAFASQWWRD